MSKVREAQVSVHGVDLNLRFDFNAAAEFAELTGLEITDETIWVTQEDGRRDLVLTPKQQRALLYAMDAAHYMALDPPEEPRHTLGKIGSVMTMESIDTITGALVNAFTNQAAAEQPEGADGVGEANPPSAPEESSD